MNKLSRKEFYRFLADYKEAARTGSWVAIAEHLQHTYYVMTEIDWQYFLLEIDVSNDDVKRLSSALDDYRMRVLEARENLQEDEYFSESELERDMLRNCEVY